jgi:Cof subfamily protein (haloacid dehalogenase superfamily)
LWCAEAGQREDLMGSNGIRLLLADVDGTLVTPDKVLTEQAIDAVRGLGKAGILFAITSGRPPRGMSMLIEPLDITTPIAAFNGGLLVNRDMSVIEQRVLSEQLVRPVAELIGSFGLDLWVYRGADWDVPDLHGSHVATESATVRFAPKLMTSLDGLTSDVAKLVGVSDDLDAVTRATSAARERFGDHVTAAQSQPYYLDVTHPDANKGAVARYLSARYSIPPQAIATIGDMPNDVLMFAHSGLSIAMGNASPEVQRAARRVTCSNSDEGFASAVQRFILHRGAAAPGPRP